MYRLSKNREHDKEHSLSSTSILSKCLTFLYTNILIRCHGDHIRTIILLIACGHLYIIGLLSTHPTHAQPHKRPPPPNTNIYICNDSYTYDII